MERSKSVWIVLLWVTMMALMGVGCEDPGGDDTPYDDSPEPIILPSTAKLTEYAPSKVYDGVYNVVAEFNIGSDATLECEVEWGYGYNDAPPTLIGQNAKWTQYDSGELTLEWDASNDAPNFAGDVYFSITCNQVGYEPTGNKIVISIDTTKVDIDADGWTISEKDCDDSNPTVNPEATDKCNGIDDDCNGKIDDPFDNDGDGAADCGTGAPDCDDDNADINPAATEVCDGKDNNCDGKTDEGFDQDGDGFTTCATPTADCNDLNPAINPSTTETCNGVDDNCSGQIDDSVGSTWYKDSDGDGYGSIEATLENCTQPEGYVQATGDCNDNDPAINPGMDEPCSSQIDLNCDGEVGYSDNDEDTFAACEECDDSNAAINPSATETCNGVDDDCNGTIDTDATAKPSWYLDADVDGSGSNAAEPVQACTQPSGYVAVTGDCNDADAAINPNATEVCDGIDNNCDTNIDTPEAADAKTWYSDVDRDGFGNPAVSGQACSQPEDFVTDDTDCNDNDFSVHPEAKEVCNGIDEDCDGLIDEGVESIFYLDQDGDTYGDPSNFLAACQKPQGYVEDDTDCGPSDPTTFPGATEYADGIDNDCDDAIDEDLPTTDDDGDGYSEATGDCNDANRDINPDAKETCDGIDNDCNGELGSAELDNDGDGVTGCDGDCNDSDRTIYPGTSEVCDGKDNNCDGVLPTNETDADRDGQRICAGDCSDTNANTYAGAVERCDGKDNNCDGQIDETCALVGYDYLVTPNAEHPDDSFTGGTGFGLGQLSDGVKATTNYLDSNWVAWRKTVEGNSSVLWQFAGTRYVESVTIGLLSSSVDGIYLPARIEVSASADGIYFGTPVSYTPSSFTGRADLVVPVNLEGKFFKVVIYQSTQPDSWIFIDDVSW